MSYVTDIPTTVNHYSSKCLAADAKDKANAERGLSRDLAYRIHSLAEKTIFAVGLILATALLGTFVSAYFGTASIAALLEPAMLKAFQSVGIVLSLAVPAILYNVYQRSSHLAEAKQYELISIKANIKAAETPSWKHDYGYVTGFLGRLLSLGMYDTQSGSKTNDDTRSYVFYC